LGAEFWSSWLTATVRLAAPLILCGVGGVFTERSGVFNIGMEGMMLVGAFAAVAGTYYTGNVWVGALMAMLAGGLVALGHAFVTVTRRANQIVSGAAINLLALGLTNLLMRQLFYHSQVRVDTFPVVASQSLRELPVLGPILFAQPVIVWIAYGVAIVMTWVLYRTNWGLNVRAVGEYPPAVATAGVSVHGTRYAGVIISGLFSGLAGAALALAELGYFVPNMTAGRGFVVLAALVVGKWNPLLVGASCLLFGAADAFQLRAQTFGFGIPYQFLVMLPYVLTIAALIGLVGRTNAPEKLGVPYSPEEQ